MQIVTLDFETFFDSEYTRSKMTTESYIRDPRFEVLGVGINVQAGTGRYAQWFPQNEVKNALAEFIGPTDAVLCHHAQFDGLILSHHYGVKPHAWLDTLSMARLLIGNHMSVSLGSLAAHFALAPKSINYASFKGKHWDELDAGTRQMLAAGCLHDAELTWQLFNQLAREFPVEEYAIVDQTIRMFTEPVLVGDVDALGQVWTDEAVKKREMLAALNVTEKDLQSTAKFVALLAAEGVEVPSKQGKNGAIYCVAKTDEFMKQLLESDDDKTRTLAEARLGVRSTIDQTRAERLGYMAGRGTLPVYLGYCGAHTTRWSGGDKVNWQNFKRGGGIRKAIQAPPGHVIIKADKSQIECRILNMIAGQIDVIDRFARKEDPYVAIASKFYGRNITRDDPAERGVGKQLELSCGYGAGAATICRTAARGTYGPPVRLSDAEGLAARNLYRSTHQGVVDLWKQAGRQISRIAGGERSEWNVVTVETGRIILPNKCPLLYPALHYHRDMETGEEFWRYKSRNGWVKLYGAKLVENLIQALSRVDMSQTLLRIRARLPTFKIALLEHDALAGVTLAKDADRVVEIVREEMCRPPAWLPDIPLDCEITVGERYS